MDSIRLGGMQVASVSQKDSIRPTLTSEYLIRYTYTPCTYDKFEHPASWLNTAKWADAIE